MERDGLMPEELPTKRAVSPTDELSVERETPKPAPAPRAEESPQPPAAEPEPVPANVPGWPGWAAFVERLKGALDIGDYSLIKNPAMAEGRFDGHKLTIWTNIEVVRTTLGKAEVAQAMARLCRELTGVARQVEVKEGQAPTEELPAERGGPIPPAADALDAFLAQGGDNIIVE